MYHREAWMMIKHIVWGNITHKIVHSGAGLVAKIVLNILGFAPGLVRRFRQRARLLTWAQRTATRPPVPEAKTFVPKLPELPRLDSYKGSFSQSFWDKFPVNRQESWDPESWISGDTLLEEAIRAGVDNLTDARAAREILVNGADTG